MITLLINGETTEIEADQTLHDLVSSVTPTTDGVAVAVNAVVVPKSTWKTVSLATGDQVEILTAAPGG